MYAVNVHLCCEYRKVVGLPAALSGGVITAVLLSEVSAHIDKGTVICEGSGN